MLDDMKLEDRLPTTPMKRSMSARDDENDEDDDNVDDETRLRPNQKEMKMCSDDEDDDVSIGRNVKEVVRSAADDKDLGVSARPPPNPASHVLQETNSLTQIENTQGETTIAGSISFQHRFHKQQKQHKNNTIFQKQQKQQNGESPSKFRSQNDKNNTNFKDKTPSKGSPTNTVSNHHNRVPHAAKICSQAPHYGTGMNREELVNIKGHPPNPL